jgi:hypothetical protein
MSFCWRNWAIHGGQVVSPTFTTPQEAGQWRRDNPPLLKDRGPTLIKLVDGEPRSPTAAELVDAYWEFSAAREELVA